MAPMPGVIDRVIVKSGDTVAEGDSLIVMVAMKMQVSSISCPHGQSTNIYVYPISLRHAEDIRYNFFTILMLRLLSFKAQGLLKKHLNPIMIVLIG